MIKLPKYFRKNASVKTIEITARGWFDKTYGNSYFSANVIVNQGMKNEICFSVPFTYGYGSYYEQKVFETLCEIGVISNEHARNKGFNLNAKVFSNISGDWKKKEVVNFPCYEEV